MVRNKKLVFTWAWRSTPERESLVTVLIEPDGDGSLLTLTHEQFFDEAARDRHSHGWTGSLDKLERYFVRNVDLRPRFHARRAVPARPRAERTLRQRAIVLRLSGDFRADPMRQFDVLMLVAQFDFGDDQAGVVTRKY